MKNKILHYFTELSIVVLGVTIALVLGNLNETRKANNKTEKSIKLMISELRDHRLVIKKVMNYQDTAFTAMKDSSVYNEDYDLRVAKLSLNSGAYLFMTYNQTLEIIDPDIAMEIMAYYTDIKDILTLETNLWNAISKTNTDNNNNKAIDVILYWSMQLYDFEQELLYENKYLLDKLQKYIKEK